MELLVSDVDRVVSTTLGHAIRFQAGVPRQVPEAVQPQCFAAGCRPAEAGKGPAETTGTDDQPSPKQVAVAIREILDEGDPDNLTSQGKARVEAVNTAMGQEIRPSIRREAERLIEKGEV